MNSIGERLKYIKTQIMNQKEFAVAIKISQGRLSELEQGKCNPSADTLISIAQTLMLT